VLLAGLDRPTSVAVAPDGALYVTNHGLLVGGREVLASSSEANQAPRIVNARKAWKENS
jgi:hypothetical protein